MSGSASPPTGCRCSRPGAAARGDPPCSMERPQAEVRLRGVEKRFGDVTAVTGIDLTIADGEFVCLLGPTGAGKTTTLRLIAGLEKPDQGQIQIGGHDAGPLSPMERNVAFIFQQYS